MEASELDQLLKYAGLSTTGKIPCWKLAGALSKKLNDGLIVQIRVKDVANEVERTALSGLRISTLEGEPVTTWISTSEGFFQVFLSEVERLNQSSIMASV